MPDRLQQARDSYSAYETGDRSALDALLTDDFVFYSPPDPGIDRARYFEVCWPNHERHGSFEYVRLIEHGDEVVVTYEATPRSISAGISSPSAPRCRPAAV